MKLPEDKAERKKVLVLILIGIGAVGFISVRFGLIPLFTRIKLKQANIITFQTERQAARDEVHHMTEIEAKNYQVVREIKEITDSFLLHPMHRSYRIPALEEIKKHATTVSLDVEVRETAIALAMPRLFGTASPNALKSYISQVSLECSYHDLISFLAEIEKDNPYLSVIALSVKGQPSVDPEKHAVSFNLQWPIWVDSEASLNSLAEQIEAGEQGGNDA